MDFGTVIWIVVLVIAPVAAILFAGAFGLLDQLGRGGLYVEERPSRPAPVPNSPAARAEREDDIRQLVQARSDRRRARGEGELDVDAEVERLMELDPSLQPEADQQDAALRPGGAPARDRAQRAPRGEGAAAAGRRGGG